MLTCAEFRELVQTVNVEHATDRERLLAIHHQLTCPHCEEWCAALTKRVGEAMDPQRRAEIDKLADDTAAKILAEMEKRLG